MSDDVIPLKEIGKIETVKVYNQAYVDKQQKRIAELEEEIGNLKKTYRKQRNKRIDDLQKKNAELKKENNVLAQNLEDTEILNKTYEKKHNDLKKENAELKLKLEALEGQTPWKDIKDKSEAIGKITKAKELLAKWVELYKPKLEGYPITPIQEQTEQFLSEVEK